MLDMTNQQAPTLHEAAYRRFHERHAALATLGNRLGELKLLTFLVAVIALLIGITHDLNPVTWVGCASVAVFAGAVIYARRVTTRRRGVKVRRDIHARHLSRMTQDWITLPVSHTVLPQDHPYAADLDLSGEGSLLQRIDTTHTARGERTLVTWLAEPADRNVIMARQEAIDELDRQFELRQELEAAAALEQSGTAKLSAEGFLRLARLPPLIVGWRRAGCFALPLLSAVVIILMNTFATASPMWWMLLAPQAALMAANAKAVRSRFALIDASHQQLEAFARLLSVIERATFQSPLLQALAQRLEVGGRPPSRHMATLAHRAGWAELRHQPLLHMVANLLLLWDWHVLASLERWNQAVGPRVDDWLTVAGEIEALASLAVVPMFGDTTFPAIGPAEEGLQASGLAHPLIAQERRVPNEVSIEGPGYVLIVTGSNMAGKSTLLRAVGLNIALALAGAPVCASSMRLPVVRLRTSMRVTDSLQTGASYFHAELLKLKAVVHDLESTPPVFFLLDELLRGTNLAARRTGATGVILHLLGQGAMGLVATHDDALTDLVDRAAVRGANVHMTDLMIDDEIVFDYRLRPGRATTSNALRLLERAGIPLPSATVAANTARI
jgi:hypothetical protein